MASSHKQVLGLTAEEHWRGFIEFCRYDMLTGGPDPHMSVVANLVHDAPLVERAWACGLYATIYNVPSMMVLLERWPTAAALLSDAGVATWVAENWAGLTFRRERRAVRSVGKLTEALYALAAHLQGHLNGIVGERDFERVWGYVQGVKYMGRYSGMKFAEALRRTGVVQAAMPDMRPVGGWSPRQALSYLHPEHVGALLGADTAENLAEANYVFDSTLFRLRANGVQIDAYRAQALLCDYKQAWHGRQYPGRAVDSELQHLAKIRPYWEQVRPQMWREVEESFYCARATSHPEWSRGELQGWGGPREDLTTTWQVHRYMWSDNLFDFHATVDFAAPARK